MKCSRRRLVWSLILIGLYCAPSAAAAQDWVVAGMVLTPAGIISDGAMSISNGVITAVGPKSSIPGAAGAVVVPGIIIPGFIDLHDHLTWNMLPRWLPGRKFNTRYEWQDTAEYDRVLSTPHAQVLGAAACETEIYAEVKALAGGATSVVGGLLKDPNHPNNEKCVMGLARNLDTDSGITAPNPGASCPTDSDIDRTLLDAVQNEVFPFELPHGRLAYLLCELSAGTLRGFVIHLSEGGSTDANAHREFNMINKEILLKGDGKTVALRDGLAFVHGSALRDQDFLAMSKSNVGLIWSPRSNDELYGSTTNIAAARQASVPIAIAPDWSPSGSAGMLQEIAYAARHHGIGSDALIAMATSVPAKMVRINNYVGSLEPKKFADFVVINVKVDPTSPKPLDPVVAATPADVALVVVGGQALYGDRPLLERVAPAKTAISDMTVCGAKKAIYLGQSAAPSLKDDWDGIRKALRQALATAGSQLAEIECD